MTWPTTAIDTTPLDANGDSLTDARVQIKAIADGYNQIKDHHGTFEVDVASGATANIGGQTANRVQITGTTTITSFGTTYSGAVFVRHSGALKITHNATTLICPDGVDLFVAAGDSYVAYPKATAGVADGWIITSYLSVPLTRGKNGMAGNLAAGHDALKAVTTGTYNVGMGDSVFKALTSGYYNHGFGYLALTALTTGYLNCAFGYNAGLSMDIGQSNCAFGVSALKFDTSGNYNSAFGTGALNVVTTSSSNTAAGWYALNSCTGASNTACGAAAGGAVTTGSYNIALGGIALGSGPNVTTNYSTALGYLSLLGTNYANTTGLGANSVVTGANQVQLGDTTVTVYAQSALSVRSDRRDKIDIADTALGLDFILQLRPVDYRWDVRQDYTEHRVMPGAGPKDLPTVETIEHPRDGSKARTRRHHGLIAQEVEAAALAAGVDFAGLQHHARNGGADVYSLAYEELIGPMIRATQQQQEQIAALLDALQHQQTQINVLMAQAAVFAGRL